MRIGYCSPFNPMKSGISDFSEELLLVLCKKMEIVIFSPVIPTNETILKNFEVHLLSDLDDDSLRSSLQIIVYHMGNNPLYHADIAKTFEKYPGILELHDFSLHSFMAQLYYVDRGPEAYLNEVRYCHGDFGVEIVSHFLKGHGQVPWNTHTLELSMNKRYIEKSTAVIVHSDMAKQMILALHSNLPVANIMLHSETVAAPVQYRKKCRTKLNLSDDIIVFGSFGYATSDKRIVPILQAIQKYRQECKQRFIYVIVGEVQQELELHTRIKEYGLEDCVRITGFTELEEFKTYMGACDFCLNLRYPTHGESSASAHRMFGMGKPVIVTDIGTFSEYPDEIAFKVRYDENESEDIYQALYKLSTNKKELTQRGRAALKYAKEFCDIEKNAEKYTKFINEIINGIWQPEYEDVLITRLFELGLTDDTYLEHFFEVAIIGLGE